MTRRVRRLAATAAALAGVTLAACSGPPVFTPSPAPPVEPAPEVPPEPEPPREEQALGGDVLVRIGIHWDRRRVRMEGPEGVVFLPEESGGATMPALELSAKGSTVVARSRGSLVEPGAALLRIGPAGEGWLLVDGRAFRGSVEVSARADSLFVVNVLPLEDYLRGVVPREIGSRVPEEREAIAAQAVAARTYTVKRFGQYGSLPFDLFASVQDQVYEGVAGEEALADDAIRETRGLVVADDSSLLEAYYSSTCGGWRADIETAWPWRASHPALRGGPDGAPGQEWCRDSRHFAWEERWTGAKLSALVREQVPIALDLPRGSVRGELRDIEVTSRDETGRTAEIEYVTDRGSWRVPGDHNRWVLRRPDGGILRSTRVTLEVRTSGGHVQEVRATGSGNGHGVGMCQVGAKARARAGQSFREILGAYYPGTKVRPLRGPDVPPGRGPAS